MTTRRDDLLNPIDIVISDHYDELRILLFTDTHLHHTNPQSRKDDYPNNILDKVSNLAAIAKYYCADLVLFAGDLFHAKDQKDQYLVAVNHVFSEFGIPVFLILGNHDIYYTNPDSVYRTPTGIVLSSGKVKHLGKLLYTDIAGKSLYIEGMDFCMNPKIPIPSKAADYSILVTHQFMPGILEEFSPDEGFKEEDINKCEYTHIFAGHDHMNYPASNKLGSFIMRPGSISRGTRNVSNKYRDVSYGILCFSKEGYNYAQENLPVLPATDIFSEESTKRGDLSKRITDFVRSLKTTFVTEQKSNIDQLLIQLCNGNQTLYKYIRNFFNDAGLI